MSTAQDFLDLAAAAAIRAPAPKQFKQFPVQLCPPGYKQCNAMAWAKTMQACGKVKPLSEFSKSSVNPGGYQHQCKNCKSTYMKKRYATTPAVRARHQYQRAYIRKRLADPAYRAQYNARKRRERTERYANDPVWRARENAYQRERYAKRKAEREAAMT